MTRQRPYTRCPVCHLIGPAESLVCTWKAASIDWRQPVLWRCGTCGHQRTIRPDDLLADDASSICGYCGQITPCPSVASRSECGSCGRAGIGPAAQRVVV
jgi:hypothetical protein